MCLRSMGDRSEQVVGRDWQEGTVEGIFDCVGGGISSALQNDRQKEDGCSRFPSSVQIGSWTVTRKVLLYAQT